MFISPAYAQVAGSSGGGDLVGFFMPLILIFLVFYFLLIRPQQKKLKQHRDMLSALSRGDKVVTGGGIIGTVSKVINDNEIVVKIANDVEIKVIRGTLADVLNKPQSISSSNDK